MKLVGEEGNAAARVPELRRGRRESRCVSDQACGESQCAREGGPTQDTELVSGYAQEGLVRGPEDRRSSLRVSRQQACSLR